MSKDPFTQLSEGNLWSIVEASNGEFMEYPDATLHTLFTDVAHRHPNQVSVRFGTLSLSYQQLDERSNQLAHHLRNEGIGPDTLVGLCVERCLDMVVGVLGILKAGGAYVPIDPKIPQDRVEYILKDSGVRIVVAQVATRAVVDRTGVQLIVLDEPRMYVHLEGLLRTNPVVDALTPDHLAYIIYTSGSTGMPKGVLVPHRGATALITTSITTFAFSTADIWAQHAAITFDFSVWEIFGALLSGGTLVMIPHDVNQDIPQLAQTLAREHVSILSMTPSVFALLRRHVGAGFLTQLRVLFLGGDHLKRACLHEWYDDNTNGLPAGLNLYNLYGPTETSILATAAGVDTKNVSELNTGNIGRPLANKRVYILDEHQQPTPVGVEGELYIGAVGVTRGYHNLAKLTAERFMPNPFHPGRMYRTGDRGRWTPEGNIEYLGRSDFQVKIRGFRIELGEIEEQLRILPDVRDAVILMREDNPNDLRLVAYVISEETHDLRPEVLKQRLGDVLPQYMVPSAYMSVASFPLTISGKLDRMALPAPDESAFVKRTYEAPQGVIEQQLAATWSSLLNVEQVGRNDNFFDLGGHSLKAVQLTNRCEDYFGVALRTSDLLSDLSLKEVAQLIFQKKSERVSESKSIYLMTEDKEDGKYALSFQQEAVYFLNLINDGANSYNFQGLIEIKGNLNVEALKTSLKLVTESHSIFRTVFNEDDDGIPYQEVLIEPQFDFEEIDCVRQGIKVDDHIQKSISIGFDIKRLPLVRWKLYHISQESYKLLQIEHHYVHDGWSFNLMIEQFIDHYNSLVEMTKIDTSSVYPPYHRYATIQRAMFGEESITEKINYWVKRIEGFPTVIPISANRSLLEYWNDIGGSIRFRLPTDAIIGIRELSTRVHLTDFDLMMACFFILLHHELKLEKMIIGTSMANRVILEFEKSIGMFVNVVPIACEVTGDMSFIDLARIVSHNVREAFDYQDVPLSRIIHAAKIKRQPGILPLIQVTFNAHNSPLPRTSMHDLDVSIYPGISNGTAKFDLSVTILSQGEGPLIMQDEDRNVVMVWEYNKSVLRSDSVEDWINRYLNVLQYLILHPSSLIREFSDI